MTWDPRHLPRQDGKTFVVTGGNAGIGYFAVEQLAASGARVIIASRNPQRIEAALTSVREQVPGADVASVVLDLSSLESVRQAASALRDLGPIDGLLENAALIGVKERGQTADGFELLFGTNHLGHFLLTALVWPALAADARVVTTGSQATRLARLKPDDLQASVGTYSWFNQYAQSKHATQAFGFELDRRLRAAGSSRLALVAHPGGGLDGVTPFRAGVNEPSRATRIGHSLQFAVGMGKDRAAWSAVRALVDPTVEGGQYWGPRWGAIGFPALGKPVASSHAPKFGASLWSRSEQLLGEPFPV
ncbi:MAG: family NAD(P)-dependent oxidoreductase [Microbacteriaceae bacterium]|nr:family NAD(P)-dependent oxidoreductase [Microbacteriaceae bacterium]